MADLSPDASSAFAPVLVFALAVETLPDPAAAGSVAAPARAVGPAADRFVPARAFGATGFASARGAVAAPADVRGDVAVTAGSLPSSLSATALRRVSSAFSSGAGVGPGSGALARRRRAAGAFAPGRSTGAGSGFADARPFAGVPAFPAGRSSTTFSPAFAAVRAAASPPSIASMKPTTRGTMCLRKREPLKMP